LQQALADKEKTKKQADEDVARLQKEVKIFKLMKYRDGYNDGMQGNPLRYPLGVGILRADQGSMEVLASHAPPMPDDSATATTIIGSSRDSLVSAALAEGQSAEACRDSEANPASRGAKAPHPDIPDIISV